MLWPDGQVFYEFDDSAGANLRAMITTAMDNIEGVTCLSFHQNPLQQRRDLRNFVENLQRKDMFRTFQHLPPGTRDLFLSSLETQLPRIEDLFGVLQTQPRYRIEDLLLGLRKTQPERLKDLFRVLYIRRIRLSDLSRFLRYLFRFLQGLPPRRQDSVLDLLREGSTRNLQGPDPLASPDFIRFQNLEGETDCNSDSIGKLGGMQIINLGDRCHNQNIIVHEIGHAIGFWHEQSRPDRDQYIKINWENVIETNEISEQFRTNPDVDYRGEQYDYASIMHYNLNAFSKNGQDTMTVINQPDQIQHNNIGLGQTFSASDIRQIQKMYKCYKPGGTLGYLSIEMQRATGLPIGEYSACITAVDTLNSKHELCTSKVFRRINDDHVNWYQELQPEPFLNWSFFEIVIYQQDVEVVIDRQTIWIESKQLTPNSFCVEKNMCVYFTYVCRD